MLYAFFWVSLISTIPRLTFPHPDTRRISFTYAPVASMWVVELHSLFLYSDPPPPRHHPSDWLRPFSSQTFYTTTFSTPVILHTYPPKKMGQSVPKRWHIKFRCQGITQKKARTQCNSSLTAFPWRRRHYDPSEHRKLLPLWRITSQKTPIFRDPLIMGMINFIWLVAKHDKTTITAE